VNVDIRRRLDRITDILWAGGVTNPVTYIEQISYLIFLRLLDEEETARELRSRVSGNGNTKSLYPEDAQQYRWSKWRFLSGRDLRDFLRDGVFPYMATIGASEPQVAEYFRDATLEIADPAVLKQVIDELDKIPFARLGADIKGDIFEYLLVHLGTSALNGQFRTPKQIRSFMVAMVDPDFGDTICDPACGTAGFLIDAVDWVLAKYSEQTYETPIYGEDWLDKRGQTLEEAKAEFPNLQTYVKGAGEKLPDWKRLEDSIFGYDVSRSMMRISMMNLVLHGIGHAQVKRANVLSEHGGLSEADIDRKYNVVLANPPFAGTLPQESIRADLPTKAKKSELLFLALMMESLAPGGRSAVVMPEGALFGSTSTHKELRRKLLHEFEVQAVVSLGAGFFKPYTGVKTSVLVFRKPTSKPKGAPTRNVWFYDLHADGYDPDKTQGGGRPETPNMNDIPALMGAWNDYKSTGFTTPPGIAANKILDAGTDEPKCWYADLATVEASDNNLSASRYKPRVSSAVSTENPAELIEEVLGLEREITAGLKALLSEVEGL
jgi:type I restriction enzyme M protein